MTSKKEIIHADIIDTGIDYENRRIYFGSLDSEDPGYVSWDSVERVIRAINTMTPPYRGKGKKKKHPPIELHMNSCGGDVEDMLRLYDVIQSCEAQIIFIGGGIIHSSAVWIMSGCDERRVHRNSSIMVHAGSIGIAEQTQQDKKILDREIEKIEDLCWQILADNTKLDKKSWQNIASRDLYLTPEEAKELGIVDTIIEYKKRGQLRKVRAHNLKQKNLSEKEFKDFMKSLWQRTRPDENKRKKLDVTLEVIEDEIDLELDIGSWEEVEAPVEKVDNPSVTSYFSKEIENDK